MENAGQDPAGQQAQGGSEGKDYKALYEDAVKESRKWEKRSKDNLEQLNALKQSQGKPDLCQDFGHGSSRNQAAIGIASGLGSVLSKKAAIASAGTL